MLSFFTRDVQVIEEGRLIEITGIAAYLIDRDIAKIWATRKIQIHMFVAMTRKKIVIPTFFAVDFVYMLDEMAKYPGSLYSERQTIKRAAEVIRANTWLSNIDKEFPSIFDYSQLKQLNISLIDHQRRFMAWYDHVKYRYNLRGILLTAAPGGGKTVASLATAICRKSDISFIISPKNAINRVWETEIVTRFKEKQIYWISSSGQPVPKNCKWFIYHYEDLQKAVDMIGDYKDKKVCVTLDESQNFNDPDSLRTGLFLKLVKSVWVSDIIFSSGTPIKAMGSDSIPLLRAIDPLFTPNAEMRFRKIFGKDAKKANDILANRLGIISYKVPKSEFMETEPVYVPMPLQIPNGDYYTLDKIRERISKFIHERVEYYANRRKDDMEFYYYCMELYEESIVKDSGEWKEYMMYKSYINTFITRGFDPGTMSEWSVFCNKFEKENIIPKLPKEHRNDFKDVKSAVKYPELKIRGEALGRVLGRERIEANVKLASVVNYPMIIAESKKKVICFSSHVEVIDTITELQKKQKLKPLKVTAETNNDLKNIVHQFEKNPGLNPLNATYQSLSTAVPMTMANTLVMLNYPFRVHELEQAVARAWRIGQDSTVIVNMVTLDTGDQPNITTRSADIMNWSKEQVDQIMGYSSATDIDISLENFDGISVLNEIEIKMEQYLDMSISQEKYTNLARMYQQLNEDTHDSSRYFN